MCLQLIVNPTPLPIAPVSALVYVKIPNLKPNPQPKVGPDDCDPLPGDRAVINMPLIITSVGILHYKDKTLVIWGPSQ